MLLHDFDGSVENENVSIEKITSIAAKKPYFSFSRSF
jgi:hypothetical protein